MKFKKFIIGMLLIVVFMAQISIISFNNYVFAENANATTREFGLSMVSTDSTVDLQKLEPGTDFEVNVNIDNLKNVGKGLISLTGQLEYDSNLLERKSITLKNGWEGLKINEANLKFVIDNGAYVTQRGEMLTIKFKVKDTIKEDKQTTIKVKRITASGGEGVIAAQDVQIGIGIKMPEVPPVEEKITSDVYVVDNKDKDISRIAPGTTVAKFKENVETEQEMVFKNKDGKTLTENDVLATGMKIKVGKTLEYTLVVTGDIDGDGIVEVNDLAKVKLHLIEKDRETLSGIYFKAGDVDNDEQITVNDCAQIKLVMINLFEIK